MNELIYNNSNNRDIIDYLNYNNKIELKKMGKKKNMSDYERLTIRVSNSDFLRLSEIKDSLNVSYSVLIRTIITDFITKNEAILDRIIDNNEKYDIHQ